MNKNKMELITSCVLIVSDMCGPQNGILICFIFIEFPVSVRSPVTTIK